MRTLAIGDIHGCHSALRALAAFVPIRPDDCLITLGDYVDRGLDSRAVLDWLIDWKKRGRLVALRGNHEAMMLGAREDDEHRLEWLLCGGDATLVSYSPSGDEGSLDHVPDAHWDFLESTKQLHQTTTHYYVHAAAIADIPLDEQPDWMALWGAFNDVAAHESGKIMVCGHTPQRSGLARSVGHAVCIDTHACKRGWLTCLEPATGRYWQANQQKETRTGWLDEE
ncbi:MAG: serine/threonine protein phosphatase [Gemmataceae bacterium]|nr:serine/threonine protein phosphatase [Gemmataceae bacterium]